jgi:hypothetical protein
MSREKGSESRIYDLYKNHQHTHREYPKNAEVHEHLLIKLQEYYDRSDAIEAALKSLSKKL